MRGSSVRSVAPFAVGVADGHGHRYTRESVDAWAAILEPTGWTAERADELRRRVLEE